MFGKVLNPNDVNVDATTGNTATNFKFDSPVYLKEGIEYCLVVMTNSLNYKVWISGLGETDVSGSNRIISTQPHLGVLFKSQNNTAWTGVQSEDLKFTMRKANFTSGSGTVTLTNMQEKQIPLSLMLGPEQAWLVNVYIKQVIIR